MDLQNVLYVYIVGLLHYKVQTQIGTAVFSRVIISVFNVFIMLLSINNGK